MAAGLAVGTAGQDAFAGLAAGGLAGLEAGFGGGLVGEVGDDLGCWECLHGFESSWGEFFWGDGLGVGTLSW